MRTSAAPSRRCWTPVRLATRKVGRARVLLGRRPALVSELDNLRVAASGALSGVLGGPVVVEARAGDTPLVPGHALGHSALFCILALAGPGSEAVLELDPRFAAALASVRTGAAVPDVPVLAVTPFERALVAEMLLTVLAALRDLGTAESRWSPRLVGVRAGRGEVEQRLGTGPVVALAIDLAAPAVRGRAVLYIPELALRAVVLQISVARADVVGGDGPWRARIDFSPRLRCGAVWAHELTGLVSGAAVVLPGAHLADGAVHGQLALVRRGVALAGTLSSAGFRLGCAEQNVPSQEVTEVDPVLSELPVELEVELARVPLSLAEIGALRPGAVLPLRVSTGDPVFLRVGDRRIARAELVEVEGEVAARVLELVP
jgi:type III secretion protein Q